MLKVWGRINSINVMKVLWVCEELSLPVEQINAGLQYGVVDTPEYAAMNPDRKIPVVDDDGFVLAESNTIIRYLAAKHGRTDLLPADPRDRADVERWMDWASFSLAVPMVPLFRQLIRTPADRRDPAIIESSRHDTERCMRIIDERVAATGHMVGTGFSLADVPAAAFAHRWLGLPVERTALPALDAYYRRMLERPGFRRHVALPLT
jgi:glutathione S-transferase